MDTNDTKALVKKFNDAWVRNDTRSMAPLVSEDVTWVLPLGMRPTDRDKIQGRDEVVNGLTVQPGSVPAEILKIETMVRTVHTLIVEGNTAAGFHHMSSQLVRGGDYSNEYVWLYTCADGKIVRLVEHVDTLHAYKQNADHPLFAALLEQ